MKEKIFHFLASLLTGILFFTISCTPGSCFEETNTYVKAYFYSSSSGKTSAPDSITLYGLNKNSDKIYNKTVKKQPASFPLDASVPSCTFVLRINGIADTIAFIYTSYPHLISKECGYTFYHSIDTPVYSRHQINKITLRKNTITTLNEENMRIFY